MIALTISLFENVTTIFLSRTQVTKYSIKEEDVRIGHPLLCVNTFYNYLFCHLSVMVRYRSTSSGEPKNK